MDEDWHDCFVNFRVYVKLEHISYALSNLIILTTSVIHLSCGFYNPGMLQSLAGCESLVRISFKYALNEVFGQRTYLLPSFGCQVDRCAQYTCHLFFKGKWLAEQLMDEHPDRPDIGFLELGVTHWSDSLHKSLWCCVCTNDLRFHSLIVTFGSSSRRLHFDPCLLVVQIRSLSKVHYLHQSDHLLLFSIRQSLRLVKLALNEVIGC